MSHPPGKMGPSMLDELGLAIKELGAEEVGELSDEELSSSILEIEKLRRQLDAAHARRLRAFDRRRLWAADGAKSAAAWLARKANTPKSEWGSRLWVARVLSDLPG